MFLFALVGCPNPATDAEGSVDIRVDHPGEKSEADSTAPRTCVDDGGRLLALMGRHADEVPRGAAGHQRTPP